LGEAASIAFVRDGCQNLMLGDVVEQKLEELRSRIIERHSGINVVVGKIDCNEEESVDALFKTAVQQFGRIDFAVNLIGIHDSTAISTGDQQGYFQKIYQEHLRSVRCASQPTVMDLISIVDLPLPEGRASSNVEAGSPQWLIVSRKYCERHQSMLDGSCSWNDSLRWDPGRCTWPEQD
jgi:NAD(P)-dependent dehydrogenase (short-subunit alcohol dehydrogenase family)